nr:immunoglobulin heavy chain junction region [Mus musculus]NSM06729.1 immunoglobulin heavy chain junction region [Mus musculus]NSM08123.1 immunoglobulin heavy chain junction region [Mus musculus]
CARRSLFDYW